VAGVIDRAYVQIIPEFKRFGAQTKAGIDRGMGQVRTGVKTGLARTEADAAAAGSRTGKAFGSKGLQAGKTFAGGLKSGLKIGAVGIGAIGVLLGTVGLHAAHLAGTFQSTTDTLVTGAGESEKAIGQIRSGLLKLAPQVATGPVALAKGMFLVESAGFHGAAGLNVMRAAAEGAKIGATDAATVSNALTTALVDYKMPASEAAKVTSQLVTAVSQGKTNMAELAGSLAAVLPVASAAKISLQDVVGAISTMTGQGIGAQQAAQNLANIIGALQKPAAGAVKYMAAMGLSSVDLAQNLGKRGLSGTLELMEQAVLKHMGKSGLVLQSSMASSKLALADANEMLKRLPPNLQKLGKELLNNQISQKEWGKVIRGQPILTANLAKQFGTTAKASQSFNDALRQHGPAAKTFSAAMAEMTGGATGLKVSLALGGANMGTYKNNIKAIGGAAAEAGGHVKGWALTQEDVDTKIDKAKATLGSFEIMIGNAFLPVLGQMADLVTAYLIPGFTHLGHGLRDVVNVVKDVIKWFRDNATVVGIIAAAITVLLLPALAAFAVAQAISLGESIALWTMYKTEAIIGAVKAVIAYTMTSAAAIGAAATAVATFAVMVAKWVWLGAQSLLAAAKVALAWIIAMGPIALVIAAVIGLVMLIVLNWNKIVNFTKAVWNAIWGFIRDHWRLIVVLLLGGLPALVAFIVAHWGAIARFISRVWASIWGFIRDHWKLIVTILTGGLAGLVLLVINKWNAIKHAIGAAIDAVIGFVKALPRRIQNIFDGALTWLLNAGIRIITGLLHGARDHGWALFKLWLIGIPRAIYSTIFKIDDFFITLGVNIMKGIWAGVKRIFNDVKDWFARLPKWIMHALGINSPPAWAISAGSWIMKGLIKGLIGGTFDFAHFLSHFTKLATGKLAGVAGKLGGAVSIGGHLGASVYQKYAASLFPALGWAQNQLGALINLWDRESGWNPRALNKSSGAYGIPQSLPASKMDAYGNRNDATTQIRWGLDYIKSAYGNPMNAYGQWLARSPHWYGGGMAPTLFTRPTLIGVGESGAETVSVSKGRRGGGIDEGVLARAVAEALAGLAIQFDGDGLARIVTKHQDRSSGKGTRR
jgi:TP901 family phage tail tape measure protein